MRYTVCFNTGASVAVEADSFHVVHTGGPAVDGSICVQFSRSLPNPRYQPVQGTTFGVDAEPNDVADDDWEIRQRRVSVNTALYVGVTEVLLTE